jgi:hypothetical protein
MTGKERLCESENPTTFEINGPSLLVEEAIVPVIIEVKAQTSNRPSDVYRALRDASDQLSGQAAFLFNDFERAQEVVAIAGAGLYWW